MKKKLWAGLTTGLLFLGLAGVANATTYNVAEGKSVALSGTFFTDGWGGGLVVAADTIVDGIFLPRGNQWDQGAVWWDDTSSSGNTLVIDLGSDFIIESFVVQADDNDGYKLEYWNLMTSSWTTAWDVPNYDVYGAGMQTRPNPADNDERYLIMPTSITTNALRFSGNPADGDRLFSVSEIQAYGAPVPEPATMLLFGTGIAGLVGSRLKRKKK